MIRFFRLHPVFSELRNPPAPNALGAGRLPSLLDSISNKERRALLFDPSERRWLEENILKSHKDSSACVPIQISLNYISATIDNTL